MKVCETDFNCSLVISSKKYPDSKWDDTRPNTWPSVLSEEVCEQKKAKKSALNAQRLEAIASLKAVHTALDTGANLELFRKYQIESRIKIDALPDTEENFLLKKISDIYTDAVHFRIMQMTGEISGLELKVARVKYKNDDNLLQLLSEMTPYATGELELELNKIKAGTVVTFLLLKANLLFMVLTQLENQ